MSALISERLRMSRSALAVLVAAIGISLALPVRSKCRYGSEPHKETRRCDS
jgi:hypothetical protein